MASRTPSAAPATTGSNTCTPPITPAKRPEWVPCPGARSSRALHDIDYQGVISMEPLPKGSSPYDARDGHIPAEKLDAELRTGLTYLREMQKLIAPYL